MFVRNFARCSAAQCKALARRISFLELAYATSCDHVQYPANTGEADWKSADPKRSWGFKSPSGHQTSTQHLRDHLADLGRALLVNDSTTDISIIALAT